MLDSSERQTQHLNGRVFVLMYTKTGDLFYSTLHTPQYRRQAPVAGTNRLKTRILFVYDDHLRADRKESPQWVGGAWFPGRNH